MGSDWKEMTLGQLGRIVTGKTPSSKGQGYFGGTIPFVTPTDFDGRRIITNTGRYLTEKGAATVAGARIPSRSVMVTCIGSDMGKAAIAGRECVTNQQINSILVGNGNDPLFVYYNLSRRKGEIRSRASGSAQPILNKSGFGALGITLPPLCEQKDITGILGSLDDKIELNRRMNRTLEAMARAIFQSWFVDFDPVRAKAAVRRQHPKWTDAQVSRAACPNLKPEIAALFPNAFEDSELGEIPKGWKAGMVGEEFNLTMGQSPPGETYNETGVGVPFFQGRADFGFRYPARRVFCTAPTRFAKAGDTLVSVRAPVGDINMASEDCCIGRGVSAIRHKSGSRSYTYYAMHTLTNDFRSFEAEGTVFGSINKGAFHALNQIVPPSHLIKTFEGTVLPLDQSIENYVGQSECLSTLRDTLLPKLISGELRVPDADRIVGRCV